MKAYDIFNGDADGICALHQLRMAEPRDAELVTGVKRDIRLLERLSAVKEAQLTVLDISFDSNRDSVQTLLAQGCKILYFDHHFAGEIPEHSGLEAHIEVSSRVCTSLLVNRYLDGKYLDWAVTAAFGDNLVEVAEEVAKPLNLTSQELGGLRQLGELLNYNGYGESLGDLHFAPDELFRAIQKYDQPLEFLARAPEASRLAEGFQEDMGRAESSEPVLESEVGRVFRFPNDAWAHRIMGVFANLMANEDASRATAMLVENPDGTLRISVRAPQSSPAGADELCRLFPTGGGRPNAAGVNNLPESELPRFLEDFERVFQSGDLSG